MMNDRKSSFLEKKIDFSFAFDALIAFRLLASDRGVEGNCLPVQFRQIRLTTLCTYT